MSRFTKYFARNNVKGTLFLSISQADTSIQLESGEGERFGNEFPFYATLENVDATFKVLKREIVKCTGRSGDILSVERAVAPCPASDDDNTQGQTAFNFDAGDTISIYITADIVNAIQNSLNDLYNNGNDRLYVKGTGGLNISVSGGNVRFNNAEHYYNGGTATLTDNATNYVMLDNTDTIIIDTTSFDNSKISLAEVITASGEIVSITPKKIDSWTGDLGGGGSLLYGDGSDGDMTISENTILNAGYQYQFTNLTICPGVVVSFSGEGGGRIKVNNTFINCGTIDMTDLDVKKGCYIEEDFKQVLCNCTWGANFIPGRGGNGGLSICYCCGNCHLEYIDGSNRQGGKGGDAIAHPTCTCAGAGGNLNTSGSYNHAGGDGCVGYNAGGGGGAAGWMGQYATPTAGGCPGNGLNGGNGGDATQIVCSYAWGNGGGGGGGFYTGNGGNGGRGGYNCSVGGDGGNGGILGNGGNGGIGTSNTTKQGGIGGNGGDGICGGNGGDGYVGGNGGNGFYGGKGGTAYGSYYQIASVPGNGGDGVIPGQGGDECSCQSGAGCGRQWAGGAVGGNGISALHSLEIKACNFCNCGAICSIGSVGGRGGCGDKAPFSGPGGRGGQGGNIMLVVDCMIEYGFISVEGGEGGLWGGPCCLDRHGPRGLPGCLIYFCGCK